MADELSVLPWLPSGPVPLCRRRSALQSLTVPLLCSVPLPPKHENCSFWKTSRIRRTVRVRRCWAAMVASGAALPGPLPHLRYLLTSLPLLPCCSALQPPRRDGQPGQAAARHVGPAARGRARCGLGRGEPMPQGLLLGAASWRMLAACLPSWLQWGPCQMPAAAGAPLPCPARSMRAVWRRRHDLVSPARPGDLPHKKQAGESSACGPLVCWRLAWPSGHRGGWPGRIARILARCLPAHLLPTSCPPLPSLLFPSSRAG